MRKRLLSTLLALCMVLALLPGMAFANGSPFSDVAENAWYYDAVKYAYENGIMSGTGGGKFSPNTVLTRAQMCQLLYNVEGLPAAGDSTFTFSDVAKGAWYYDAVSWAVGHDIIDGAGNDQFNPGGLVSREQMAVILYQYSAYKGYDTTAAADISGFSDAAQVSSWAETAMRWAVGEGLVRGVTDTAIAPKGSFNRASFATVMMRFCQKHEEPDAEILAAIEAGLVPASQQGSYQAQVDYRDFCALLDALVQKTRPEKAAEWARVSADFRDGDKKMLRAEGMVLLLYAAECMEMDAVKSQDYLMLQGVAMEKNLDFREDELLIQADVWSFLTEEKVFRIYSNEAIDNDPDWYWRRGADYYQSAVTFACFISPISGKTYFDYDENGLIHPAGVFTREAAIHAVERLYETTMYVTYEPYSGERFQLSAEAQRKAEAMPDVAYNALPDWHGQTYNNCGDWMAIVSGKYFLKEKVDLIAELGFNYIRAPLLVQNLFDGDDISRISAAYLQNLDDLVEWCAENQIHLCLSMREMQGFATAGLGENDTLFTEEATQKLFADIWGFFAEHYADVPVNMLSFNLLNEPGMNGGDIVPDDLYGKVMIPAIDAIRAVTPDRLIFVDVLGVFDGNPAESLADQKVVQAVHSYPHEAFWQYPGYQIQETIGRDMGTLEFCGSFPAGTTVTLKLRNIDMDSQGSVLSVTADGKVVETFTFTDWSPDDGPQTYNPTRDLYTATLKEPASSIRIEQSEGEWYAHHWIALETDGYTTQFVGEQTYRYVGPHVPVLTIAEDGTPTPEQEDMLYIYNQDSVRAVFEKYREFTERTGETVMVQEFGYNQSFSSKTASAIADSFLSVLEELGIPWCIWDEDYGPIISEVAEWYTTSFWDRSILREGGNYQPVSEHYLADMGLLEALQKHMD